MTDAQRIYDFFAGTGVDHAGRTIEDYLDMSNETLELLHDYIQWAFPTRQASQCEDANAPLLSDEALDLFSYGSIARGNYYSMWVRITRFYMETDHWLADTNHNHKRITRIIESSAEFFNVATAEIFANIIFNRNRDAGSPVNTKSIDFWLRALDAAMARSDKPIATVEVVGGYCVPKQMES